MLSETGVPARCGALRYRRSAALASAFTRPCRRGSFRFGDSTCPELVAYLRRHRQNHVLATRTESLLQGIDGLTKPRCVEGGSRYVAGARLNRRWHLTSYFCELLPAERLALCKRSDVRVGSFSEVDARIGEVCFVPINGLRQSGLSGPKSAINGSAPQARSARRVFKRTRFH